MTVATMTPAGLIAEAEEICDQVAADAWAASPQGRLLVGYNLRFAVDQIAVCGLLAGGFITYADLGGEEDPPMIAAERALDAAKAARGRLDEELRRAARNTDRQVAA